MAFVPALPNKAASAGPHAGVRAALRVTSTAHAFDGLLDEHQDGAAAVKDAKPKAGPPRISPAAAGVRGQAAGSARAGSASTPLAGLPIVLPLPSQTPLRASAAAAQAAVGGDDTANATPGASLQGVTSAVKLSSGIEALAQNEADVGDEPAAATSPSTLIVQPPSTATPGPDKVRAGPPPATGATGHADASAPGPQPAASLLQAASAAGATLVKAQALQATRGASLGGKAASASPVAAAKAAAAGGAAAPSPDLAATDTDPVLLAAFSDTGGEGGDGDPSEPDDPGAASAQPDGAQSGVAGALAPFAAPLTSSTSTAAASTPLSASAADLAAQMAARVRVGHSEFKLSLNPLGLGQVDVTVSIGADRQLTASLAFSDPRTAHALSAHAAELKGALEQAGFNVPRDGFDFSSPGAASAQAVGTSGASAGGANLGGGFGGPGHDGGARIAQAAFDGEPLDNRAASGAPAYTGGADRRLDIRI